MVPSFTKISQKIILIKFFKYKFYSSNDFEYVN